MSIQSVFARLTDMASALLTKMQKYMYYLIINSRCIIPQESSKFFISVNIQLYTDKHTNTCKHTNKQQATNRDREFQCLQEQEGVSVGVSRIAYG